MRVKDNTCWHLGVKLIEVGNFGSLHVHAWWDKIYFKIFQMYFYLQCGVKLKDVENWNILVAVYLRQSSNGSFEALIIKGMRVWNETRVCLVDTSQNAHVGIFSCFNKRTVCMATVNQSKKNKSQKMAKIIFFSHSLSKQTVCKKPWIF